MPNDYDYSNINTLTNIIESLERGINSKIYVIDFYKRKYIYVSDSIIDFCRLKTYNDETYNFFYESTSRHDHNKLQEIYISFFKEFHNLNDKSKKSITVCTNFTALGNNHKKIAINHKFIPLLLNKNGDIWIAVCLTAISCKNMIDRSYYQIKDSEYYHEFSPRTKCWTKKKEIEISYTEKDILRLSAFGSSVATIAEQLNRSIDCIKTIKRKLFLKFDTQNISEAITYAKNKGLI